MFGINYSTTWLLVPKMSGVMYGIASLGADLLKFFCILALTKLSCLPTPPLSFRPNSGVVTLNSFSPNFYPPCLLLKR
jgi:hypothetical protein